VKLGVFMLWTEMRGDAAKSGLDPALQMASPYAPGPLTQLTPGQRSHALHSADVAAFPVPRRAASPRRAAKRPTPAVTD
jgi:hypothetical protein